MKINIKEKNDSVILLNLQLEWKDIESDYNDVQNKVLSSSKEKGARKGKLRGIQKDIFLKNNRDYVNSSFVDHALNLYYRKALQEKNIIPINQGNVSKLKFEGMNTDFEFTIEFEIRPIINKKIPNYEKKITIKTNHYKATKSDVDKTLDELRVQHATMKSVDKKGKLKSGDFIHADFTKLDKSGTPVEGGTLPNHHIKIGEGLFMGDLEKPFINKKIGDTINIKVDQDNGKVDYSVKINKIEQQILPKVDNDFVKIVDNNLKTVEELRNKFKDNIQLNLDNENKKEFHNKIIEYFIDKTKFDIPPSMVDNYRSYLVEDYKAKDPKAFDEEKMAPQLDEISNKNIKWLLIREHLVEKEKIFLGEDEVKNKIKDMIAESPQYKKDIKKFYNEEQNKNKLKEDILNSKFFNKMDNYFVNKTKEVSTDKIKNKKG